MPAAQLYFSGERDRKMRPPSSQPSAARGTAKHKGGSTELPMTTKTPSCSKPRLKKGPWTPEEDELLSSCIAREGEGRWRTLPKRAGLLRCGKSCRLRWMNYLRPDVKRGHIAPDEEDLILRLHRLLGNRWSLIAGRIPGRTDNEIKNYWNTHLSKKLISQGIDPRTHKPLSTTTTTTIDHQQQLLPMTTLLLSNHHNHIGPSSSSAAAFEHDFCRIPPVPKVNWNYNWEEEAAAAENYNNSGSLDLQNCQVVPGFDGEKEKEEDFNEVFSSFLNSLINEDVLVFNDIVNGGTGSASATPSTAALSDTNNNNIC